jgi:hypothetical protein
MQDITNKDYLKPSSLDVNSLAYCFSFTLSSLSDVISLAFCTLRVNQGGRRQKPLSFTKVLAKGVNR